MHSFTGPGGALLGVHLGRERGVSAGLHHIDEYCHHARALSICSGVSGQYSLHPRPQPVWSRRPPRERRCGG